MATDADPATDFTAFRRAPDPWLVRALRISRPLEETGRPYHLREGEAA